MYEQTSQDEHIFRYLVEFRVFVGGFDLGKLLSLHYECYFDT